MRILTLALMASTLVMAGCSYSPARIQPEPLVVIEGDGHRHDRQSGTTHYRQGSFCPPGQAKKGRC